MTPETDSDLAFIAGCQRCGNAVFNVRLALIKAEAALEEMKQVAEKVLDPEYMKDLTQNELLMAACKRIKVAEAKVKDLEELLKLSVTPCQEDVLDRAWKALLNFKPIGDEHVPPDEPHYNFLD